MKEFLKINEQTMNERDAEYIMYPHLLKFCADRQKIYFLYANLGSPFSIGTSTFPIRSGEA